MTDEQPNGFHRQVTSRTASFIVSGLGLVAALAWNDAIRSLFGRLFGEARGGLIAQFGYAIVITVLVVFLTTRVFKHPDV